MGIAAGINRLEGARRCRQPGGKGFARHIEIARPVHRRIPGDIISAATEITGVAQHRIDNERPVGIVTPDLEGDRLRVFQPVTARDLPALTPDDLVKDRFALPQLSRANAQH